MAEPGQAPTMKTAGGRWYPDRIDFGDDSDDDDSEDERGHEMTQQAMEQYGKMSKGQKVDCDRNNLPGDRQKPYPGKEFAAEPCQCRSQTKPSKRPAPVATLAGEDWNFHHAFRDVGAQVQRKRREYLHVIEQFWPGVDLRNLLPHAQRHSRLPANPLDWANSMLERLSRLAEITQGDMIQAHELLRRAPTARGGTEGDLLSSKAIDEALELGKRESWLSEVAAAAAVAKQAAASETITDSPAEASPSNADTPQSPADTATEEEREMSEADDEIPRPDLEDMNATAMRKMSELRLQPSQQSPPLRLVDDDMPFVHSVSAPAAYGRHQPRHTASDLRPRQQPQFGKPYLPYGQPRPLLQQRYAGLSNSQQRRPAEEIQHQFGQQAPLPPRDTDPGSSEAGSSAQGDRQVSAERRRWEGQPSQAHPQRPTWQENQQRQQNFGQPEPRPGGRRVRVIERRRRSEHYGPRGELIGRGFERETEREYNEDEEEEL